MKAIPVKQSVYADYLYKKMWELVEKQGGAFTLRELSDYAKLKVTGNFRRRVNHWVVTGHLAVEPVLHDRRGSCNLYYNPNTVAREIEGS